MTTFFRLSAATLVSVGLLAGCGSTPVSNSAPVSHGGSTNTNAYVDYGTVQSIEAVPAQGNASGAGAIIGGVAGAALGNQVGSGSGRAAATVAGAVGGAMAGNAVEKRRNTSAAHFRINVRTDRGLTQTFEQTNDPGLRVGDRVRVVDGQLYRL